MECSFRQSSVWICVCVCVCVFTVYCTLWSWGKWYIRKNHHKEHLDVWTGTSWHFQVNILRLPWYLDGNREPRLAFWMCTAQDKDKPVGYATAWIPEIHRVINIVLTTVKLSHQHPRLADNVGVTAANRNTSRGIEASSFPTKRRWKKMTWYGYYIWAILLCYIIFVYQR